MIKPARKIPRQEIEDTCVALLDDEENGYDAGICVCCGETCNGVEPDAEYYYCEACGENGVFGAEQALMLFASI